jgi:hypothetical protein
MNYYWRSFTKSVSWFVQKGEKAQVGATAPPGSWRPHSAMFGELFPVLQDVLSAAYTTPVRKAGRGYVLFSWPPKGLSWLKRAFSWLTRAPIPQWLSPEPSSAPPAGLFKEHAILLRSFGGIVESVDETESTWLLAHNDVLTAAEASRKESFIDAIALAFPDKRVPIDLSPYYSIAMEANSNTTLCHRQSGAVLLFAPDHAFDHVTPLPGFPELTLYELHGAPTFRDWVNVIATQWRDALSGV